LTKTAPPETIGTTFKLFTSKNRKPYEGQYLDYNNKTTLLVSNFNASNNVKIIIHGFGSSTRVGFVINVTQALLSIVSIATIGQIYQFHTFI